MKRVMILGGTGTLGTEIIRQLKKVPVEEIRVFSRDELKQKQLAGKAQDRRVTFRLGDIRDSHAVLRAMSGVDTVFHVSALKHVDSMEENPEESVATNIQGTINVANAAESWGVRHVVFSSTDKAVDPINVYGMSKAISERILFRRNELQNQTKFVVYRWGNVVGSRGSVIPHFWNAIKSNQKVSVTDPRMSRFWINIDDAVTYMLKTFADAPRNYPMIPPIKAASVLRVIEALGEIADKPVEYYNVGLRRGEKLHEVLVSQHEGSLCMESGTYEQYDDEELKQVLTRGLIAEGLLWQ